MQVKALSNIKHDQVEYEANDVFDIDNAAGQVLVDSGVAVNTADSPKGGKPAESKRLDKQPEKAVAGPNIEWSRSQLNARAEELGLEVKGLPNKQAVLDAIEGADQKV